MPSGIYERKIVSDEQRYIVDINTGCWNYAMHIKSTGYGDYWSIKDKKDIGAHVYFYKKYKGNLSKGLVLDHLCRNTKCVNPDHLEAVSFSENIRRGKVAKLNISSVDKIKSFYKEGYSQLTLASMFGVSQSEISRIVNNLRWSIQCA